MSTKANEPAFPTPGHPGKFVDAGCGDTYTTSDTPGVPGLTKCEYFAAHAPAQEIHDLLVMLGENDDTDWLGHLRSVAKARLMWAQQMVATLEDSHGS
jgi:hypothetical protein